MLNSQIKSQNPRIRSNTTRIRKKQEARRGRPARETRRSNNTRREDGRIPQRSSRTSLLRTRHVLFDPCSSTIAKLLTTVLLLLLDMFPVAAGIAERVGGAAALLKVIVPSPDPRHFTPSSCILLQVEPIFSNSLAMLIQLLLV